MRLNTVKFRQTKLFKHNDLLKKKNIKNIKDIFDTINYAKKIKLLSLFLKFLF